MDFRIADTFTSSLSRLTPDEQKAVKTAAFDIQMNPAHPGMQFHRVSRTRDKDFWSVRVNSDLRLIVHIVRRRACFSATSITTTRPMPGRSVARSRSTRPRAQPSSSR